MGREVKRSLVGQCPRERSTEASSVRDGEGRLRPAVLSEDVEAPTLAKGHSSGRSRFARAIRHAASKYSHLSRALLNKKEKKKIQRRRAFFFSNKSSGRVPLHSDETGSGQT